MPHRFKVTTAGAVHEARWVLLLRYLHNVFCFELSPAFIERHPYYDAGKIMQIFHNGFPFVAENGFRLSGTVLIGGASVYTGAGFPMIAEVAAGHILPYQHP